MDGAPRRGEETERSRLETALFRISEAAHTAASLDELYPALHRIVGELMPAGNFFIAVLDPDGETLRFPYFVDECDPPPGPRRRGRGLTEYVIRTGESLLAPGEVLLALSARGEAELVGAPAHDWLGVPLRTQDRTIGALVLQSYTPGVDFDEGDRDVLGFVSRQIAVAIERTRAQAAQRAALVRFRTLAEMAPAGIFSADAFGRLDYVNDLWLRLTSLPAAEALGDRWLRVVHPEDQERVAREWLAAARGGRSFESELRFLSPEGRTLWALVRAAALRDESGGPGGFVGTAVDITEHKRAEEQLAHQATHDPLTGLPNRILFDDRLRLGVIHAERLRQGLAVLFLDLDGFKPVNDELGHEAGDFLLRRVAERLERSVRAGDTVARFGGDEFAVLLPGVSSPADVGAVASKILGAMGEPVAYGTRALVVSASIGGSLYPAHASDPGALLRLADAAMYRAKQRGRGSFQLAPAFGECRPSGSADPDAPA